MFVMRILALTNLYPNPLQPQRAPFNRHRLRMLGERYPLRVIAPVAWTDELRALRAGTLRIPAHRTATLDDLNIEHPRYLYVPGALRGWSGQFYWWSVRSTFRRVREEFDPTIVYSPWAYPDGWAALRLGREAGLPVVIQVHGSDVLLLNKFPARRRPTREAVCSADAVIAVSEDIARHLEALGVPRDRIHVIYDGVDRSLFRPGPKGEARVRLGLDCSEPIVLFVGNLVPVKGLDVLLDACSLLHAMGVPAKLIAIGEGPLRQQLAIQAQRLGLPNHVRFLGSLPQTELPDWYRAANVLVLPSHSEGVPNVLLEASACGTPWIASRVGGIPEIADLGRGRLVPPAQPVELAEAIRAMLKSDTLSTGDERMPRDRRESVDELEQVLAEVEARHIAIRSNVG